MKRGLLNLVAVIGLIMLVGALIFGMLTGALFLFPSLTIFGAKAVNERDTQIVYRDPALVEAFENGKFILESTGTKIEVKMSNSGYAGEGTIVVNENATGIAFNSMSRTLIEWTQTLYNNETYYRIKVLEPSGVVFNQEPTTVYINLPHRAPSDNFRHDFVLQNRYSTVNFSFVDNNSRQSDALKIGNLVVESAATVNIAASENISLDTVNIKSNSTKFVCQSAVLGDVSVTGYSGEQTFNASIGGKVVIKGNYNHFHGDSAGDVNFESNQGNLIMNDVNKLTAKTVRGDVSVNSVANGVVMTTEHGNLWVGTIANGGLNFTAGGENAANATASVAVDNRLVGKVDVKNYGIGGINLFGVDGNVDIESSQVGGGEINVSFQSTISNYVVIRGYDGNINVRGINGRADITVRNWELGAGAANIFAQFKQVFGSANCIRTGGYVSGHNDWGNVEIELLNSCNNFGLYLFGASSTICEKYGYNNENKLHVINDGSPERANQITVTEGANSSGTLKIYSKQTVRLY